MTGTPTSNAIVHCQKRSPQVQGGREGLLDIQNEIKQLHRADVAACSRLCLMSISNVLSSMCMYVKTRFACVFCQQTYSQNSAFKKEMVCCCSVLYHSKMQFAFMSRQTCIHPIRWCVYRHSEVDHVKCVYVCLESHTPYVFNILTTVIRKTFRLEATKKNNKTKKQTNTNKTKQNKKRNFPDLQL